MEVTCSRSCPVAGFVISGIGSSVVSTMVLANRLNISCYVLKFIKLTLYFSSMMILYLILWNPMDSDF
jgi:hypothetical protein